jgi:SET domain-containing protein
MILPCLYIALTRSMGRGVFTSQDIDAGTIVEESPVIVMTGDERKLLDQTRLYNYIFEWGAKKKQCCMALGYIAVYNHSYKSNCEYEMNFEKELITVKAVHFIRAGEELFINYNGPWDNIKPVWFETK